MTNPLSDIYIYIIRGQLQIIERYNILFIVVDDSFWRSIPPSVEVAGASYAFFLSAKIQELLSVPKYLLIISDSFTLPIHKIHS